MLNVIEWPVRNIKLNIFAFNFHTTTRLLWRHHELKQLKEKQKRATGQIVNVKNPLQSVIISNLIFLFLSPRIILSNVTHLLLRVRVAYLWIIIANRHRQSESCLVSWEVIAFASPPVRVWNGW